VVLKPDAIRERLLRLEEVVSRLEELRRDDRDLFQRDFRNAWALERGLQLGAEIVFDVGNHVLSAHFGISAKDYEDIVAQLGDLGVIRPATREQMKGLGGFRNILVHGYLRIDAERVLAQLASAPARFSEFSRDVRDWLPRAVRAGDDVP
jgi:uncharacterized protein YutE (UPF0331/DUF86 family)